MRMLAKTENREKALKSQPRPSQRVMAQKLSPARGFAPIRIKKFLTKRGNEAKIHLASCQEERKKREKKEEGEKIRRKQKQARTKT